MAASPRRQPRAGGFWQLWHEDLAALLVRTDLSWGTARVYLALADLTIGYGKGRDVVSLGQIAERAGMTRRHVSRALERLKKLKLYGYHEVRKHVKVRWVLWPPPPVPESGNSNHTDAVPAAGNSGVPGAGNSPVPRAVPNGVPDVGTHQDSEITKTGKKGKDRASAPPDPRVETFMQIFSDMYRDRVGTKYLVSSGKDRALAKDLLHKLDGDEDVDDPVAELLQAAERMFDDRWGRSYAGIGVLASQINHWRNPGWATARDRPAKNSALPAALPVAEDEYLVTLDNEKERNNDGRISPRDNDRRVS